MSDALQATSDAARKLKGGTTLTNMLTEAAKASGAIIKTAEAVRDQVDHLGQEEATKLLRGCEENLRVVLRSHVEGQSQKAALDTVPAALTTEVCGAVDPFVCRADRTPSSRAAAALCSPSRPLLSRPRQVTPDGVKTAYVEAVNKRTTSQLDAVEAHEDFKKLKRVMAEAADGGAGTSAEHDAMGDEGFEFTQATRSLKCPFTQATFASKGENRPVRHPSCKMPGCTVSFGGLKNAMGRKANIECPNWSCKNWLVLSQMADDKEMIKEVRKAEAAEAAEED
jgi:hypothetical protein